MLEGRHARSLPAAILPLRLLRATCLTTWPLLGLSQWRLSAHVNTTPPANQRAERYGFVGGQEQAPPPPNPPALPGGREERPQLLRHVTAHLGWEVVARRNTI